MEMVKEGDEEKLKGCFGGVELSSLMSSTDCFFCK